MKKTFSKYCIIGAGLSGLTTAYMLTKSGIEDFTILESRTRIGGRILSKNHIDFGATWFQNHHTNVLELLDELQLDKFSQYSAGKSVLVYNSMAPEHYFESDPNTPSAHRISGSSIQLIDRLTIKFKEKINTATTVTKIIKKDKGVEIITDNGIHICEKVVITIPPRIATQIKFSPELPKQVRATMEKTHTWMSNAIKVGMTFKTPFWKAKNMSGTVIGQVGAVTELYDHTDAKNEHFALMGFVNEALRDLTTKERKQKILTHLAKYLGSEILDYISYEEKDWSQDKHTSGESIKSIYMSPSYGNPIFSDFHLEGTLLFSGAETSPVHGGYMDGAIYTGIRAAQKLI